MCEYTINSAKNCNVWAYDSMLNIYLVFSALLLTMCVFCLHIKKNFQRIQSKRVSERNKTNESNVWYTFNQLENLLLACLFIVVCKHIFGVCKWSVFKWMMDYYAGNKRINRNEKMFEGNFITTFCCWFFFLFLTLSPPFRLFNQTLLLLGMCRKQYFIL